MSKNNNLLTTRKRQVVRAILRQAYGDLCHWCGREMKFPEKGGVHSNTARSVTIEHSIAKLKGDTKQMIYLRLVHKECNR